jgi:protoheme IX farnesyltransferase
VYTPLKRVSTLNTIVGAVPGALPPLIGWAAASGGASAGGWALFALQFFWQVPHFLAIAWLYREDYARAGLKMLPVVDPAGERTGLQSIGHTLGLLTASLSPVALGLAGPAYLLGALALGGAMLGLAVRFARRLDRGAARGLFLASIVYLPAVLGLMVLDRVR